MLLWRFGTEYPEFQDEIGELITSWRKEVDMIRDSKIENKKILTNLRNERNN
jgi:hypothetical protein